MSHIHRVLIVEDDYAFRWSLAMRCQSREIDADVAETLREAHDLVSRSKDYCGVVLDLRMAGGDGTTLLDSIAAREKKPNVVIVTGYQDVWERVAPAKKAMVDTTLFKPADVDVAIDAAVRKC